MKILILDVEVYSNYFLLSFKVAGKSKIYRREQYPEAGMEVNIPNLRRIIAENVIVTFNGTKYDLPILAAVLAGKANQEIKILSDELILSEKTTWRVLKQHNLTIPVSNHIDLINIAPGMSSLKIYGGRLNAPHLESLPIDPSATITLEQREQLIQYCINDLETTELLYNALKQQLDLRESMSNQYRLPLNGKSDPQIAQAVIISQVSKKTGNTYRKVQTMPSEVTYSPPPIIRFQSDHLNERLERLAQESFLVKGAVELPQWIKKELVEIGGKKYQMGIGGLHSLEKRQCLKAEDKMLILEMDVISYYPNIIINLGLFPENIGPEFLRVYKSVVSQRVVAKKKMQEIGSQIADLDADLSPDKIAKLKIDYAIYKTESDSKKLQANSSFGLFGSKFSPFYDPSLLIRVTLTGQLALLMLIERLHNQGVACVSANTDGIILHCPVHLEQEMLDVCKEWELDTALVLERTDYKSIHMRDVNNYLNIKTDEKVKRKGAFAPTGLAKNPDFPIVYTAIEAFLTDAIPLATTIQSSRDITQFLKLRRVTGGATWRESMIGNCVRFYYSTDVSDNEAILYVKNGNKVPQSNGARPLMDLPATFPDDVNYDKYNEMAKKVLKAIGVLN